MSFSQAVYSNLDEANTQLQAYFSNKITTRAWDPDVVVGLNQWVQDTNDLNEHWYGDDVEQFWIDIANGYRPTIDRLTNNNPDMLQNWIGVGRVLGGDVPVDPNAGETTSPASIAFDTAQSSGITGALNVAQDQLDEIAARQQERNDQFEKFAPFVIPALGLAAFYIFLKS